MTETSDPIPELPFDKPELTSETSLNESIWAIAAQVRKRKVSFFFGAGMSASLGVPTGATLANEIVKQLFLEENNAVTVPELARTFPLEVLAEALEMHGPARRTGLDEFLREKIKPAAGQEPNGHKALVALAPYLTRIYTTNFDLLIEDTFKHGFVSAVAASDFAKIRKAESDGVPAILHIHGAFPGPLKITESELLSMEIPFTEFLTKDLMSQIFVFVGYSVTDPDFRPVYFQIQNILKANKDLQKKTYVVSRVEGSARRLAEKCWSARGFDLLPMDASDFMQLLRVAVRFNESKDEFILVNKRIHGESGDQRMLANDVQTVVSALADLDNDDVLDCLDELTRRSDK